MTATAERTRHAVRFWEAQTLETGGEWHEQKKGDATIIVFNDVAVLGLESNRPASNGLGQRTYDEEAVKAAIPLYENARVFGRHIFPPEEPEIDDLVGRLKGVYYDDQKKRLRARELRITRTPRTEHLIEVLKTNDDHAGLSHDISGIEDQHGTIIEIRRVWSVDTVPATGTTGGLFESADGPNTLRFDTADCEDGQPFRVQAGDGRWFQLQPVQEAQVSETPNKPDDKGAGGATTVNLEDLQRRLTESEARNKKLEERLDASEKRAQEAESRERKERDARVLESALTDSGLPEASITRLREALSGKSEEDIKAGIDAEKKYAESFGWKPGESSTETPGKETKVTGAGPERKTESGGKGAGDPSEAEQCEQEFMESMGRDIGFYDDDAKRFVGAETTTEKAGA